MDVRLDRQPPAARLCPGPRCRLGPQTPTVRALTAIPNDRFRHRLFDIPVLPGYITGERDQQATISNSQQRAIQNYRSRLNERGLVRFEVLGRDTDRDLIRALARRLAEDTPHSSELRAEVTKSIATEPRKKGGILAALRRSPLVGADLDLTRSRNPGRNVEI